MDNTIKVKFGKIIITLIFAVILTLSMGITVFAATSAEGKINDYKTYGSSTITKTTAKATTSYTSDGATTVSATYTYTNKVTNDEGQYTKNSGYTRYCSVEFSAPTGFQSYKISSSHKVTAYGQTWAATTSASYEK